MLTIDGIGLPEEQRDCIKRHSRFFSEAVPRLKGVLIKVFGRSIVPGEEVKALVFVLDRLAVEDFMEILLLAGNGYGNGALRLLRGMFERVVHARYFSRHPEDVRAFLDYDYVHQKKGLEHGIPLPHDQAEEVRKQYERVKAQSVDPNSSRVRGSWTQKDVLSMAREVGLADSYVTHFYWPTLQAHTTVMAIKSRLKESEGRLRFEQGQQRDEASVALCGAHMLVAFMLGDHNKYFALGLDGDLPSVLNDFKASWEEQPP